MSWYDLSASRALPLQLSHSRFASRRVARGEQSAVASRMWDISQGEIRKWGWSVRCSTAKCSEDGAQGSQLSTRMLCNR